MKTIRSHWLEILTITCAAVMMSIALGHAKNDKKTVSTEVGYTLEVVDGLQSLDGVNRHGEIAGSLNRRGVFIDRKDKSVEFDCLQFDRPDEHYTAPTGINNNGAVVGSCASGTFGFVRRRDGSLYQFSFPGADQTTPFGMNDREEVVGEYITPFPSPDVSGWYRFKSFLRKGDGQYDTLAAPPHKDDLGAPHSLTRTAAVGINNRGEVIGTYETIFTPDNTAGLWDSFLYSNGQWTDLPKETWPIGINNDSQILMQTATGFALYDDGRLFTVNAPAGYRWATLSGINDLGQLYGVVMEEATRLFLRVIATPAN